MDHRTGLFRALNEHNSRESIATLDLPHFTRLFQGLENWFAANFKTPSRIQHFKRNR